MSDEDAAAPDIQEPVRGPSAVLAEAREKQGLSQKDVADKLFLTTTFIRYIDDGEFERIPKPAFIKGYLRSYARTVGLSGDLIVELYEQALQAADPTPEIRDVTEEKVGTASITGPVLQTGIVGLLLLGLVIALIWWLVTDSEDEAPPQVTQRSLEGPRLEQIAVSPEPVIDQLQQDEVPQSAAATTPEVPDAAQMQIDDAAEALSFSSEVEEPAVELAAAMVEAEAEADAQEQEAAADEPTEAAGPREITIDRTTENGRNYITVDAAGSDQIELSFTDECWVEVNDTLHGLVYQDLRRVGDILTVRGSAPFEVLLGKASGVEMIYNGRPFDLEPYTGRDRTAKLTISE